MGLPYREIESNILACSLLKTEIMQKGVSDFIDNGANKYENWMYEKAGVTK
ncbi:MAG: hypothetical protein L3J39_16265 [Verrucomicrobiales bacterium]|nr:hypothetical protein [Verrucomicrobiales bacterium]